MKFRIAGCCIAMLLLLTTSAFAQWQVAYQGSPGTTFNAVHFPTSLVGYCVGAGVIYKTSDGGGTWVQQTSPVPDGLNDVWFLDANTGFAVGAAGTIIRTTNGGTNWTKHPQDSIITTKAIMSICFVGTTGWMCGGVDNVKAEVYKTVDGGTTWANVTVTNPSTDQGTDISFLNANKGYMSCDGGTGGGPQIMYTTDGGLNWTGSLVDEGGYPYTRHDIECIKAVNDSVAVASGWGSMIGGQPTMLLVTQDSGAHFKCADATYPWATYGYGWNIAVATTTQAMLVGGGASSASISIGLYGNRMTTIERNPAFFWDDLNDACYLPGSDKDIVAVGNNGCIARSADNGLTWKFYYSPTTFLQGICDIDGVGPTNRVYAAGVSSSFITFEADGTAKIGVISPENWGAEIQDIDYVVNDTIPSGGGWKPEYNDVMYACGKNGYFCKSIDFGLTWEELDHTNSNFSIYFGMHWFDPDTAVIVGCKDDGANHRKEHIWRTTDGGQTLSIVWAPQLPRTNTEWNGVAFAPEDPSIGVVVGDDKWVAYTSDRGFHWTLGTTNLPAADSLTDIDRVVLINRTTGFAVGEKGRLLKTTDSGHTWQNQVVPWAATLQLWSIEYDTPNMLWVTGPDRMCYYSSNGGSTWTQINVGLVATTYDVKSIYYQGTTGALWAGTEYGTIAKRTDQPVTGTDTPKLPFALDQNYPNPFNPSTTIEFTIAKNDHVRLNVYDVSGRLVATVMNKNLKAGKHTVSFNARELATGVYFYKLSTSTGDEIRKMVLIR